MMLENQFDQYLTNEVFSHVNPSHTCEYSESVEETESEVVSEPETIIEEETEE